MEKDDYKILVRGGDYVGWAEIQLKQDYQRKIQKGFRMVGAKEAALQELIHDLLEKRDRGTAMSFRCPRKLREYGDWWATTDMSIPKQKKMHIQHPSVSN